MVYLAVLLSVLQGTALRGSKMAVSLSALSLGATPFQVGLIAAIFAVFPLILAVYAGKVSDRIGVVKPIFGGALMMACGMAIPALAASGLAMLMVASLLVGLGHIFFHVSIHNLIGSYGDGEARTRNFATFSLGASISAFFGPSLTGFSIDGFGFHATFLLLVAISLLPAIIIAVYPRLVPPRTAHASKESGGSLELLANPGLRRTLIMSGVTLTGIELFTFYFPVYGRSIGMSASAIGIVMSSYAVAAFIVRMGMNSAARRLGEVGVLTASLFIAGITYLLVPFVSHAALLALMSFLLGVGLGCAQPLTIILTYNHAPAGRSGEALGMRLTVNKLTQIAVPVVFGGLGSAFGLIPVFWANGAFLLLGGVISLAEQRVSRPAPQPEGD